MSSTPARALDAVLAATIVVVALGFTTAMRSFAAAKIGMLELGVGAALVLAAFVPAPRVPRVVPIVVAGVLGLGLLVRPDAEGLAATGWLVALAGLAGLVAMRSPLWSDRRLATIVAIPLVGALVLSLLQSLGIAVLDASATSFGGTHGAVVGTVGNPVENTWLLVLGVALVHGLAPSRAGWLAIGLVAWIVVVDRARATLGVGVIALALLLGRRPAAAPRIGAFVLVVIAAFALWRWDAASAMSGRAFLLELGAKMVVDARGIPQGAGAFARDVPAAQQAALDAAPAQAGFASQLDHAHCDALELGYELGAPGIAALAWLVSAIVGALRRDPSPRRCTAIATLVLGATFGLVGYPLFSPACAVLLALATGLALAPAAAGPAVAPRWPHALTCITVGAALVVLAVRQSAAELAITSALAAHVAGDDVRGHAQANRAALLFPGADAWFYVGNFELARGDHARAAAAYRRSLALRPRAEASANLALCTAAPR